MCMHKHAWVNDTMGRVEVCCIAHTLTETSVQERFNWQEGGLHEERPLISYGPCQFPTLGLIVQRQWSALSPVPA